MGQIISRGGKWWDNWFLELAKYVSTASKDPSTKVSAVITDNKTLISLGFNGFPEDVEDDIDLYIDRAKKYSLIVHAEMNAIRHSNRDLTGCTIYTYPIPPCEKCAAEIIKKGIKRVVSIPMNEEVASRWSEGVNAAKQMFENAGVEFFIFQE